VAGAKVQREIMTALYPVLVNIKAVVRSEWAREVYSISLDIVFDETGRAQTLVNIHFRPEYKP